MLPASSTVTPGAPGGGAVGQLWTCYRCRSGARVLLSRRSCRSSFGQRRDQLRRNDPRGCSDELKTFDPDLIVAHQWRNLDHTRAATSSPSSWWPSVCRQRYASLSMNSPVSPPSWLRSTARGVGLGDPPPSPDEIIVTQPVAITPHGTNVCGAVARRDNPELTVRTSRRAKGGRSAHGGRVSPHRHKRAPAPRRGSIGPVRLGR